jgi:hypothetical protein
MKPGIQEDDLLLDVWDSCYEHDRRQNVFRNILRRGLMAALEAGELPEAVIDACKLDLILEKKKRRGGRRQETAVQVVPVAQPYGFAPQPIYQPPQDPYWQQPQRPRQPEYDPRPQYDERREPEYGTDDREYAPRQRRDERGTEAQEARFPASEPRVEPQTRQPEPQAEPEATSAASPAAVAAPEARPADTAPTKGKKTIGLLM